MEGIAIAASKQEQAALARRELSLIDAYPEIEAYHQNDFLRFLDDKHTEYLVARKKEAKSVDDPKKAQAWAERAREGFRESLGPMPEGGAGRSRIAKTIDKGDYIVDAIYIESVPDVYMTANFYYPKAAAGRLPAILLFCGHAAEGKASPTYVSFCVEAAANGFCVLTFDPIGQGERKIAGSGDAGGEAWLDPVGAHCMIDRKLSLFGEHLAAYMMKENVLALDYLLTRREADPERIAVTGNSGGGCMSAFMGAYDSRIRAVAPSCYITELRAMLYRILAQDAEQCLPGFLERGLDHSDLIAAAAPKPYMIGAALFDFFPIDGTRDAYLEAKQLYRLLGHADNLGIYAAPKGHGFWEDTREQVLRFLGEHLGADYAANRPIDYETLPDEAELSCGTAAGERSLLPGMPAYVRKKAASLPEPDGRQQTFDAETARKSVLDVLRIPDEPNGPGTSFDFAGCSGSASGIAARPGAVSNIAGSESYGEGAFESEPGMRIHAAWERGSGSQEAVLLCVGEGRPEAGAAEYSLRLTVHPRGTGLGKVDERSAFGIFDPESANAYNARMLGRTLQGMRVVDVLAAIEGVRRTPGFEYAPITLYGREEHALTAVYAAVIARPAVSGLIAEGLLHSFRLIAEHDEHTWGPAIFAAGLLERFDVGDLLAVLPEDAVRVIGPLDQRKRLMT